MPQDTQEIPMGNRLTKIYTRTGDDGTTGLADGGRVPKDHRRIEALGGLDELNSLIGMIMVQAEPDVPHELERIQNQLFDLGAEIATPGATRTGVKDVDWLEKALDGYNEQLPPLKEFILPGGGSAATFCHLARAVCRRTERRLVTLGREEQVNPHSMRYVNRLSDVLFVLARVLARRNGGSEVFWQPGTPE
jgi:cob(I)alamin adenosyltransferase